MMCGMCVRVCVGAWVCGCVGAWVRCSRGNEHGGPPGLKSAALGPLHALLSSSFPRRQSSGGGGHWSVVVVHGFKLSRLFHHHPSSLIPTHYSSHQFPPLFSRLSCYHLLSAAAAARRLCPGTSMQHTYTQYRRYCFAISPKALLLLYLLYYRSTSASLPFLFLEKGFLFSWCTVVVLLLPCASSTFPLLPSPHPSR